MDRLAELLSEEASADTRFESTSLAPEGKVDWVELGVGGRRYKVSYAQQHADRFRILWNGVPSPGSAKRKATLYFTNLHAATECAQLLEQADAADRQFGNKLLAGIRRRPKDTPLDLGQLLAAAAAPGQHAGPDHQQAAPGPAAAAAAAPAAPGAAALGAQQQNGPVGFAHLGPPAALPAPASLAHMTAGLTSMHLANTAAAAAAAAAGPSGHRPMPPAPQVPPPAAGSSQAPRPPAGAAASGMRRGFLGPGPQQQQQQQQPPMAGRQQGHGRDVQKGAAAAGGGAGAGGGVQQSAGQHALAAAQSRLLPAVQAAAPSECSTCPAAPPLPMVVVPPQHKQQQRPDGAAQQQQLQVPGACPGQVAWPVQRGPAVLLFRRLPPGFYPVVIEASKRSMGKGGFAEVFACSVRWAADGSQVLVPAGYRPQHLPTQVIIKQMRCEGAQEELWKFQGWLDIVMGPYLRGVVPVLGAWGYSVGGRIMELCYAMPDMGHAYCSLGDALLCGRFIAAAPGAGDVVTRYCYSGLWIMDRRERISRQVQVLAQGLPYAVVLVLVWKMLEVALLLHDQGAVHADTKSGNFLVDPSPLIPLVQRLLAAAAAAAKLEGAAAEELLAAAFQPEEWTQVAAMLQVLMCDRDSLLIRDALGRLLGCGLTIYGDKSYWAPEVDKLHAERKAAQAVEAAATFPAMVFGIGCSGVQLLLGCCQEFLSRDMTSTERLNPTDAEIPLQQLFAALDPPPPWELAHILIRLLQQDPAKRPTPDEIRELLPRLAAFFLPKTFEDVLKPERLAKGQPCSTHKALLAEYGRCRAPRVQVSLGFGGAVPGAVPGEAPGMLVPQQQLVGPQHQQQQQQQQVVAASQQGQLQEGGGSPEDVVWRQDKDPLVLLFRRLPPGLTPVVVEGSKEELGDSTFACTIDWVEDGSELLVPGHSKQQLPTRVVIRVMHCSDQNQEQLHEFQAQFDTVMGQHMPGAVPVLGAWGYSVGGRIMELCYAMPHLGPSFCSLAAAFLPKPLPGELEAGAFYCNSGLWILYRATGVRRQVMLLKQRLPFAAVMVLVRKMLEVALALNGEGAAHGDLCDQTFLLDPTPLQPLVQRLLSAGEAAAAADSDKALADALDPEVWTQVANELQVLAGARERIRIAEPFERWTVGCGLFPLRSYAYQAPEVRALAADPAAAALKAATWPAMVFAIGCTGAQLLLGCSREDLLHILESPGGWDKLCTALGVPWEARVDLGKLLHPDPGKRPKPHKARALLLVSSAFFTKAYFCDTLQPKRGDVLERAGKLSDEQAMQVVQALQSITQHHEFRAAYARSRPNCVVPPVEFVVGVAPTATIEAPGAAAAASGTAAPAAASGAPGDGRMAGNSSSSKRPPDQACQEAAKRARVLEGGLAAGDRDQYLQL